MTRLRYLLVAASWMAAATAHPALAQTPGTGTGPVAAACKAEIAKFCAAKEHGAGEVRKCLEANKAEVSAGCKSALESTGPGKGMGANKN